MLRSLYNRWLCWRGFHAWLVWNDDTKTAKCRDCAKPFIRLGSEVSERLGRGFTRV